MKNMVKKFDEFYEKYNAAKIVRQLIIEFSLPLAFSVAYTMFTSEGKSSAALLHSGMLNFFAFGWATSQWNRVKKQINVERNLSSVGDDVKSMIMKLEGHTTELIAYSTSKDSYCLAELVPLGDNAPFKVMLRHYGE